jgi:hypothetical protein
MSGINGDKARFHRLRKQKLARRVRQQKMLESSSKQADLVVRSFQAKPREK